MIADTPAMMPMILVACAPMGLAGVSDLCSDLYSDDGLQTMDRRLQQRVRARNPESP